MVKIKREIKNEENFMLANRNFRRGIDFESRFFAYSKIKILTRHENIKFLYEFERFSNI